MDLFEYQGKLYFAQYGIPVSAGKAVDTVEEAVAAADELGYPVVIKAQVLTGGRGKAGGVKIAKDAATARQYAGSILGLDIKGHIVRRLWVESATHFIEEYYASFTLDRSRKLHLGMLSREGGVEIEEVAVNHPDAIARIYVDPVVGLTESIAREWVQAAKLNDNPQVVDQAVDVLMKLYRCYIEGDATLAEINPLVLTRDGRIHALDAKVSLDDAALFRHEAWKSLEGLESMDERERAAQEKGLQYVGLEGSVGIIANGAGLAMSTVDIVNQVGGKPANFLDIGGGASADHMANALTVINDDPNVKVIFINIFGGITRCDEVARGILQAMGRVEMRSPIVVRLDGTNAPEGRAIIEENASEMLKMQPNMLVAAQSALEFAKGR